MFFVEFDVGSIEFVDFDFFLGFEVIYEVVFVFGG